MRGLTLLCLVGFIVTAALYQGGTAPTTKTKRSPLSRRPFDSTNGTNSSTFTVDDLEGTIKPPVVQWNGTLRPVESHFGFPPELEEDTQAVHHNVSVEATVKEDALERP